MSHEVIVANLAISFSGPMQPIVISWADDDDGPVR